MLWRNVKYLGQLLSSDLSWSQHIEAICTKARKVLGLLYHQFCNNVSPRVLVELSLSLVSPYLEYGAQIWHPYLIRDINALENIQKFCTSKKMDNELSWIAQPLPTTFFRLFLSLITFFKITCNFFHFSTNYLTTTLRSSSSRHYIIPTQYSIPFSCTNQFTHSIFPNTISLWNSLTSEAQSCTNPVVFKLTLVCVRQMSCTWCCKL